MNASLFPTRDRLIALAVLIGCAGCSGGGGGSGGMSIVSCSLQCNDASGGSQISCGVTNVSVNQEIRITFTSPLDPLTVTNNTFQLTQSTPGSGHGSTPAGGFDLDPLDPRTLIYRPQLTFDSAGNAVFGLIQGRTYQLRVPGAESNDVPPYIRDVNGTPNARRLSCSLIASEPKRDANPGRPRATVLVLRRDADGDPSDGDLVRTGEDDDGFPIPGETVGDPKFFDALGATRVHRDSPVRIDFDDVMNPDTLANPVTGTSEFIRAFVDADGITTDPSDQVPMLGRFTLTIDQANLRTTVVFEPSGGLPSAGSACAGESGSGCRSVVVELSSQIVDLGDNSVVNAGRFAFTPEKILFDPIVIEESFADLTREDTLRTGSSWGSGTLGTGPGGGSGRLGDLVVLPRTVVVLDTDSEDFSGVTNPAVFNPIHIIDPSPPAGPPALPVVGGVFEFSRLRVDAGGVLRFKGSRPARVYVRGVADVAGLIDVSGSSGILQRSTSLTGGVGGLPGPNGGTGGRGGARPDGSAFQGNGPPPFGPIGGVPNPGVGPIDVLDPASYALVNGLDGGGIAFPSTIDPSPTFVAAGKAGLGWPQPTALFPGLHMPQDVTDISGMPYESRIQCTYPVPSSPGSGGGHALDGGVGDMTFVPLSPMPVPPDSPGGDSGELMIDDMVRTLSPELGLLRGGAGGGGGGGHLQFTGINGSFRDCSIPVPQGTPAQIVAYVAHSSAGGGGGGGGLQLASGRRTILSGVIDASGGDGGSGTFPPDAATSLDLPQAGGGGAGGSVLLQSQRVQIQAVPGRINIAGGEGGEGTGDNDFPVTPSTGGRGSPGFLRIETPTPLDVDNEKAKVDPPESDLVTQFPGSSIEDILSTAVWEPTTIPPSSWSGAQSCWIRPSGNFFKLAFADDADVPCEPGHSGAEPGWDMRLRITGQANPQSFRGANDISGMTLEQLFGVDFGTSPVIVRFQGARATGTLTDPCVVPDTGGPIAAASLTEWVCHPALLNDFHRDEQGNVDDSLSPNIFRFVILWDRSQSDFTGIEGVEDLTVTIHPD
jgi:hypothetical protein